jgi:4-amino-4-deoxy-L-arabinose transferase-like glycosyltransferase
VPERLRSPYGLAAAGLLVVAGLVFSRALDTRTNYDEGVYLASIDALRHGAKLGSDVYASQAPAFYDLARVLAAPFGHSIAGIRFSFVLVAVLGVLAAYLAGSRLYGRPAGLAAAALLTVAPPYPTVASTVSADVPSVVFGLLALALVAVALRRESRFWWSFAAGASLGLAVLIKLLALPFAAPLVAIALAARAGRKVLPAAALGALAAGGAIVLWNADALPELWRSIVLDHEQAHSIGSHWINVHWIRSFLDLHTPFGWLVPAGFVAFLVSREARRTWPLWTGVPATWAFLLYIRPLADHHFVLLAAAYAIAAGSALALGIAALPQRLRVAAIAVACLFVTAGFYQEQRRLVRNDAPEPSEIRWAVSAVRANTAPKDLVVSDQQVVNFLARRRAVGFLVDASSTRVESGALTAAGILRSIDRSRPTAVVVDRMFRLVPGLLPGLATRYPVRLSCGGASLYLPRRPVEPEPACAA